MRKAQKRRRDWDLSPEERVECRAALGLIEGSGRTLLEVVRAGLERVGMRVERVTVGEACDRYLRRLLELRRRGQTFRWYEARFAVVCRTFGEAGLDEVSRAMWRDWLEGMEVAHATRRGYLRAVHALYAFARSCEPPLCGVNQVEGLRLAAPNREHEVSVLTADEAARVLRGAGEYRHAIALMLFAGVRPFEIAGQDKPPLRWEDVDRTARTIRVAAAVSKTGKARVIERPLDGLWAWLEDAPASGRVCPFAVRQAMLRARRVLGHWAPDVLRHTAATVMLALWQDVGRVSQVLGHEGRTYLLHQRYRGLMTRAEAARIAALRP